MMNKKKNTWNTAIHKNRIIPVKIINILYGKVSYVKYNHSVLCVTSHKEKTCTLFFTFVYNYFYFFYFF